MLQLKYLATPIFQKVTPKKGHLLKNRTKKKGH